MNLRRVAVIFAALGCFLFFTLYERLVFFAGATNVGNADTKRRRETSGQRDFKVPLDGAVFVSLVRCRSFAGGSVDDVPRLSTNRRGVHERHAASSNVGSAAWAARVPGG